MNVGMWWKAVRVIPRIDKEEWQRLDVVARWLISTRAAVLLMTFISAALAGLFALRDGQFDLGRWALLALGLVFAHATNNLVNDFTDFKRGVDKDNYFRTQYGPQPIEQGLMTQRELFAYIAFSGLVAVAAGIPLVIYGGTTALILMALGILFVLFYTWPLKYIGLGEVAVALAWWLVVLGADYVQRRQFFVIPAATAASFALLAANILLANGFPDAAADARVGKKTLVVRLGARRAAWAYLLIALLAHGWLALAVWLLIPPDRALWGLVSLPLSLAAGALLLRHAGQPQRLRPAIVLTIAAALVHALAIAAALASMAR